MICWFPGGFTVRLLRLSFTLLSSLALGLLFASTGLEAQNPFQSGVKYRTHFVVYDVQKKSTTTLFTIEGEWHAPNWNVDWLMIRVLRLGISHLLLP